MSSFITLNNAVRFVLSLLMANAIVSCVVPTEINSPVPSSVPGIDLAFSEVLSGPYATGEQMEPAVIVARDTTGLAGITALLNQEDSRSLLAAFPDGIPNDEIVVGIFREANGSGGYPIIAYEVVADDGQMFVYSTFCQPKPLDTNTLVVTHYFQIISIKLSESSQKEAIVHLIPTAALC